MCKNLHSNQGHRPTCLTLLTFFFHFRPLLPDRSSCCNASAASLISFARLPSSVASCRTYTQRESAISRRYIVKIDPHYHKNEQIEIAAQGHCHSKLYLNVLGSSDNGFRTPYVLKDKAEGKGSNTHTTKYLRNT